MVDVFLASKRKKWSMFSLVKGGVAAGKLPPVNSMNRNLEEGHVHAVADLRGFSSNVAEVVSQTLIQ